MENKTIRIALSSVLIYLIFKKSYDILTELLLWLNIELRIENNFLLVSLNIIIGIISLFLLSFLYNRFLKNEIPKTKEVYILLILTMILSLIIGGISKLYVSYLIKIDLDEFRMTHLSQYVWSIELDMIFMILGLIYFLLKLRTKKNTVANN